MRSGQTELLAGLAAEGFWSPRLGARVTTGAMVSAGRLRDTTATLSWLAYSKGTWQIRVRPGASLPTGTGIDGLSLVPGVTGSVDPYLSVVAATGGTWVGALSAEARTPLYDGRDGVTQGAFGRTDLVGGRRFNDLIVSTGLSTIVQQPTLRELALTASGLWHLSDRWAAGVQARVPLAGSADPSPYPIAVGLSVRSVLGKPEDDH